MAEHHQHCRFIGGGLLQTRRDQKRFDQKSRPTIACFATSASAIACASTIAASNQKDGLNILLFFITMDDPFQASIKAASLFGIFMMWSNFTFEVFKFSWHIISTSPGEENYKAVSKVSCEECKGFFNGELDEDGKFICFICQGFIR